MPLRAAPDSDDCWVAEVSFGLFVAPGKYKFAFRFHVAFDAAADAAVYATNDAAWVASHEAWTKVIRAAVDAGRDYATQA